MRKASLGDAQQANTLPTRRSAQRAPPNHQKSPTHDVKYTAPPRPGSRARGPPTPAPGSAIAAPGPRPVTRTNIEKRVTYAQDAARAKMITTFSKPGTPSRNRKVDAYLPPLTAHTGAKPKPQYNESIAKLESRSPRAKPKLLAQRASTQQATLRPESGNLKSKAPTTKAPVTKTHVSKASVPTVPVTKEQGPKSPVTKAPASKAPITRAPRPPSGKPAFNQPHVPKKILEARPPSGKPELKTTRTTSNGKPELKTTPRPPSGKAAVYQAHVPKKILQARPIIGKPVMKLVPRPQHGISELNAATRPMNGKPEWKATPRPPSGQFAINQPPVPKKKREARPPSGKPELKATPRPLIEKPEFRPHPPGPKPRSPESRAASRPASAVKKEDNNTKKATSRAAAVGHAGVTGFVPRPPTAPKERPRPPIQFKHAPKPPSTEASGSKPRPYPGRQPIGAQQKPQSRDGIVVAEKQAETGPAAVPTPSASPRKDEIKIHKKEAPSTKDDVRVQVKKEFGPSKFEIKREPNTARTETTRAADTEIADGADGADDDDYKYEDDFEDYDSSDNDENPHNDDQNTNRDTDHDSYDPETDGVHAYMARVDQTTLRWELRRWQETLARLQAHKDQDEREMDDTWSWYAETQAKLEKLTWELVRYVQGEKQAEAEVEKAKHRPKDLERINDDLEALNFAEEVDLLEDIKRANVEEEMVKAFKGGRLDDLIRDINENELKEILNENLILQRKVNELREALTDVQLFGDRSGPDRPRGTKIIDHTNDGCLGAFVKIRTIEMEKKSINGKEQATKPRQLSPVQISSLIDTQDLEEDSCLEMFMKERKEKSNQIMKKKSKLQMTPQIDNATDETNAKPSTTDIPRRRTLVTDIVKDLNDLPVFESERNITKITDKSYEIINDVSDLPDIIENRKATESPNKKMDRRVNRTQIIPTRDDDNNDVLSENVTQLPTWRSTRPSYAGKRRVVNNRPFQQQASTSNGLLPNISGAPDRQEARMVKWNTTDLSNKTPAPKTADLPHISDKKTGIFHSRKQM